MMIKRTFITALLIAGSVVGVHAQKAIWSHAIGNWRNGPIVYITPLIATTEAFTTPKLIAQYKEQFPELKEATDIDVLRFATPEEGNESRTTLKAKYGMRKLEVKMLELPGAKEE